MDLLCRWRVRTSGILLWGKNLWAQSYRVRYFLLVSELNEIWRPTYLEEKKYIHLFLCFCTHRGHQSSCCSITTKKLSGTSYIFQMDAYLAKQLTIVILFAQKCMRSSFILQYVDNSSLAFRGLYHGSGFIHFCSLP